jgi:hypothetical protein
MIAGEWTACFEKQTDEQLSEREDAGYPVLAGYRYLFRISKIRKIAQAPTNALISIPIRFDSSFSQCPFGITIVVSAPDILVELHT